MLLKFKSALSLCLTMSCLYLVPNYSFANTVDLLFLYDQASARQLGNPSTTFRTWVNSMNNFLDNSQVNNLNLRFVGAENYQPQAGNADAVLEEINRSSKVDNIRRQYGADYVALITTVTNVARQNDPFGVGGRICGVAQLQTPYALIGASCGAKTVLHELGHTWGLMHSRRQSYQKGEGAGSGTGVGRNKILTNYAFGYGVDSQFITIMAYPNAFGYPRSQLSTFSNPSIKHQGVATGQANQSDAARVLRENASRYSNQLASKNGSNSGNDTNNDNNNGQVQDRNKNCSYWAKQGYCTSRQYKSYMQSTCQKSCSSSSTDSQGGTSRLTDNSQYLNQCPSWAARGYCTGRYERFMKNNCELSCSR